MKVKLKFKSLQLTGRSEAPKVVKSYRIDPDEFIEAEAACQAQHGCGLSSIIGPLVKAYFELDKPKT
jgi:hypothetical protein